MKILHVMAGAKHGGAETACIDLCLAMHEAGLDVALATRRNDARNARLIDAGIAVYTMPFGGAVDLYTPFALRRVIKQFQPDVIQGWMQRGPAKIPAWRPDMGVSRYHVFARLGGYYKLKYFTSVEHFTTITPDIKRHLVDHGVPDDHVRHINNFAETENEKDINPIDRAEFDTPDDAPLLLGLGRLHDAKGFDTLIAAVSEIPDIHLWIAGEGPDRVKLEALIAQLDCADRVKLLGWRDDRAALFRAVDLCVFSSRYEPFGTVFVQAWANHTPLVTTNADGPRQFVRDGEDGIVVPIDDIAAMKAAIQRAVSEPKLCKSLVKNGYERYENEFTKSRCVAQYLDYYQDVIKSSHADITASG